MYTTDDRKEKFKNFTSRDSRGGQVGEVKEVRGSRRDVYISTIVESSERRLDLVSPRTPKEPEDHQDREVGTTLVLERHSCHVEKYVVESLR